MFKEIKPNPKVVLGKNRDKEALKLNIPVEIIQSSNDGYFLIYEQEQDKSEILGDLDEYFPKRQILSSKNDDFFKIVVR